MARKLLKKWMPSPEQVMAQKSLRFLWGIIHQPYLWHLTRHSAAKAFSIGLFWAMIPMPFQMVPAAICAFLFRANLPLSMALVWLTNPLTWGPVWFTTYKFGCVLIGDPALPDDIELSATFLVEGIDLIWRQLYVGSFVAGVILAVMGFFGLNGFWRWHSVRRWQRRALLHKRRDSH